MSVSGASIVCACAGSMVRAVHAIGTSEERERTRRWMSCGQGLWRTFCARVANGMTRADGVLQRVTCTVPVMRRALARSTVRS